jgi:hypothetical protein
MIVGLQAPAPNSPMISGDVWSGPSPVSAAITASSVGRLRHDHLWLAGFREAPSARPRQMPSTTRSSPDGISDSMGAHHGLQFSPSRSDSS